jgi:hypothetical protein
MKTIQAINELQAQKWQSLKQQIKEMFLGQNPITLNALNAAIYRIDEIDSDTIAEGSTEPSFWLDMMTERRRLQRRLDINTKRQEAQNSFAIFNSQSDQTFFCIKYDAYFKDVIAVNHAEQIERNFETAFSEIPSSDQMHSALKFVYFFCAGINSSYYRTKYAEAASLLSSLIDEDNFVKTCENIAELDQLK